MVRDDGAKERDPGGEGVGTMKNLCKTCYICGADLQGHGGSVYPTFNEKAGKYVSFCRECSNTIDSELSKRSPFDSFSQEDEFLHETIEALKKREKVIEVLKKRETDNHGK